MTVTITSAPPLGQLEPVKLPYSKSIATRAVVLGARRGEPMPPLPCDDAKVMAAGVAVSNGLVDVRDCGAALRFLTAHHATMPGHDVVIDGTPRLRERPVAPLVDALTGLGAEIEYLRECGHAPLHIRGKNLSGKVAIDCSQSSQYASALLLAGLEVELAGDVTSRPYIALTRAMIDGQVGMERDWSASGPWLALRAMGYGIELTGMNAESAQGDKVAVGLYGTLHNGCLVHDFTDTPDIVMGLAATACAVGCKFRFNGLRNLRLKESDRIEAMVGTMRQLGYELHTDGDDTLWYDGAKLAPTSLNIDSRRDHRLAMAVAPLAVKHPGISISDAECVSKSYPGFWEELQSRNFKLVYN